MKPYLHHTAVSLCVARHGVSGFPVVVSGVQLLSISTRLHHNLSRLAVSYFTFIMHLEVMCFCSCSDYVYTVNCLFMSTFIYRTVSAATSCCRLHFVHCLLYAMNYITK